MTRKVLRPENPKIPETGNSAVIKKATNILNLHFQKL